MSDERKEPRLPGPMRDPHWSELGDPERVERLRQVVREMDYAVQRLSRDIAILKTHRHVGEEGKLYHPAFSYRYEDSDNHTYTGVSKNKEWF